MSTRDDHSSAYKVATSLGVAETALFTLTIVLNLVATAVSDNVSFYLNIVIAMSAFTYSALYMIDDLHMWYQAESGRRKGAIEDAFHAKLTPKRTKDYYNNNASDSETKYALNLYESCYFTEAILRKMLPGIIAKMALAAIALALLMFCFDPAVVVIFAQGVFSTCVLFGCTGSIVCYSRVKRLSEIFFNVFVTRQYDGDGPDAIVLKSATLEYEAVKAHYKVRLSSRIFNKNNAQLSQKWNDLLQEMNPAIVSPDPS
ncbi:hypothetical protein [Ellagibacter isourolithinifaciens]|uniref:hypothetical protein n=1 Tax=Eggerthellaceae TaxID=1643826 RepID=UPI003A94A38A